VCGGGLETSKRGGLGLRTTVAPDRKKVYAYTQAAASFITRVADTKVKTVSEPLDDNMATTREHFFLAFSRRSNFKTYTSSMLYGY
jgi:hypothetical protein